MSYTLNGFIELSAACHISRLDEYKWNEESREKEINGRLDMNSEK